MLTFFVPWRIGTELRNKEQSWDMTFVKHKFSDRQMELMKFFSLKYECLDAQDDFSAQ
jgi:hypothetical protein